MGQQDEVVAFSEKLYQMRGDSLNILLVLPNEGHGGPIDIRTLSHVCVCSRKSRSGNITLNLFFRGKRGTNNIFVPVKIIHPDFYTFLFERNLGTDDNPKYPDHVFFAKTALTQKEFFRAKTVLQGGKTIELQPLNEFAPHNWQLYVLEDSDAYQKLGVLRERELQGAKWSVPARSISAGVDILPTPKNPFKTGPREDRERRIAQRRKKTKSTE